MNSQKKSYVQNSPYHQYDQENDQFDISIQDDETQINAILRNLKAKYLQLDNIIQNKEGEKYQLVEDMNVLNQRLQTLNKSVMKKKVAFDNYDKILRDAEGAFFKLTESTKTLLNVVKTENQKMSKVILKPHQLQ